MKMRNLAVLVSMVFAASLGVSCFAQAQDFRRSDDIKFEEKKAEPEIESRTKDIAVKIDADKLRKELEEAINKYGLKDISADRSHALAIVQRCIQELKNVDASLTI